MSRKAIGPENYKDENREFIIESARIIFGRYGYKKSTLEDVAKQAKKGKSSLYYYFNSKDEIFHAVVAAEAEELKTKLQDIINQYGDPIHKMKNYITSRMNLIKEFPSFDETLNSTFLEEFDFVQGIRKISLEEEIGIFTNILQYGVNVGIFEILNIPLVANCLTIAMKGYDQDIIQQYFDKEGLEQKVQEMLEVLCKGILVHHKD